MNKKTQLSPELLTAVVRSAAAKEAGARRELEASIRAARAGGVPLRSVAAAAGVSYETVRRIAG